jgi:predicted ATPase
MKKKIGIENFRVFKEMTEFEIRPLTLLVGPNNSGKSSFTKLILAFKDDLHSIKFNEKENHNLESFGKVLNWSSDSENIVIRPSYNIPFLNNDFSYQIALKDNSIYSIDILNVLDGKKIMSVKVIDSQGNEEDAYYNNLSELLLNIDIKFIVDLIYDKQFYFKQKFIGGPNKGFFTLKNESISNEIDESYNLKNIFQTIENEISSLDRDYLLFDLYRDNVNITKFYKDQIVDHQNKLITKGFSQDVFPGEIISKSSFLDLKKNFISNVKRNLIKKLEIDLDLDNLEVKYSKLGLLMFSADSIIKKEIEALFHDFPRNILNDKPIYYISANRGSQKRVLQNSSENQINEIIVDYSLIDNPNLEYLKEVLQIFDIEGELIVERFENTISRICLQQNDKKVNLADLGFGYSQVIPIFLKIITELKKLGSSGSNFNDPMTLDFTLGITIIIEEPEANLHPNLQSKFADFLVLTLKKFPKVNFIVETHSEYLIRKLQYLTAKGDLKTDDTVIHYFNKDKYVSRLEPKVKQIFINEDGGLTDSFGPGFFDETTRLQFDLIRLQKQQMN